MNILSIFTTILNFFKEHKALAVIIYAVAVTALLFWWIKRYNTLEDDRDRLSTNQTALMTDLETYKTESGKNAAKVTELELTSGEFEKLCDEQKKVIEDLNLKVKRLELVSTTGTETSAGGTTTLRDTVIYTKVNTDTKYVTKYDTIYKYKTVYDIVNGDTVYRTKVDTVYQQNTDTIYSTLVPDTVKYFKWNDEWNEISGTIKGDQVDCQYHGTDTLTIAATRVPKKFLFFKWGCKYVEVNLVNQNPSSKITYNRTIKFKK